MHFTEFFFFENPLFDLNCIDHRNYADVMQHIIDVKLEC